MKPTFERDAVTFGGSPASKSRHNLRLGEIADVVQELLIPMASRDEVRVQEAIERFNKSL